VSRDRWFEELILTQAESIFKSGRAAAGGSRTLIIEGQVPYDQELAVLCINGGRVQVLAARTNCMERLLLLEGHEALVAVSDFTPPSCNAHVHRCLPLSAIECPLYAV
jgi:hypothetical protein